MRDENEALAQLTSTTSVVHCENSAVCADMKCKWYALHRKYHGKVMVLVAPYATHSRRLGGSGTMMLYVTCNELLSTTPCFVH